MNYFFSTKNSTAVNNFIMLLIRVFIGVSMMYLHGLPKLELLLSGKEIEFYSLLTLSPRNTLIFTILIEMIGSFLIIIGLFTRISAMFLITVMLVATFAVQFGEPFSVKEGSLLYLSVYVLIAAFGPLRFSIDQMLTSRRESKW